MRVYILCSYDQICGVYASWELAENAAREREVQHHHILDCEVLGFAVREAKADSGAESVA
jgi:hypothetical protein